MKKIISSTIILLGAALLLGGCNEKQRLSEKMRGVWAGAPEPLTNTGAARASLVRVLNFTPTGENGEGTVVITGYINVDNTMPSTDSIITPLTISASGVVTVTGFYQVKDDDEAVLDLDTSSMTIDVDPDGVKLNYDVLDGTSESQVTKLKGAAAMLATQQVTHAARQVFSNMHLMEDIEVDKNLMSFESGHSDLTFRRQDSSEALNPQQQ